MTVLERYLLSAMVYAGLPVLGLLLGLFGFLTFAEELEDVGSGRFGVVEAMRVTLLSLPMVSQSLLPVVALMSVLVGLGTLASQQEMTALRAAGVSRLQLAKPVVMGALLMGGFALASQQWLIPALSSPIADLRSSANTGTEPGDGIWTRSDGDMVRIGSVRMRLIPADLEIYQLDARGHLERFIRAASADVLAQSVWLLHDVEISTVAGPTVNVERVDRLVWRSALSRGQIDTIVGSLDSAALSDLWSYVGHLQSNGLENRSARMVFWQLAGLPIGILGMALLGTPFVLGSVRTMPAGTRVTIGVAAGAGFYLLEQVLSQVAVLYALPPLPLAWGPDLALIAIALVALSAGGR